MAAVKTIYCSVVLHFCNHAIYIPVGHWFCVVVFPRGFGRSLVVLQLCIQSYIETVVYVPNWGLDCHFYVVKQATWRSNRLHIS